MPNDLANRLTRKLGLIQTPGKDVMKQFAKRARELQEQGGTVDPAAIRAALDTFPSEFKTTNYLYHGEPMEPLLTEIEEL
jgi:hypothetical protein